ncbi:repressor LexA [Nibricoccus aquaticus]|uniref:Repressor LexA n=1 Tax=Nibricoccus aquaticus TaxID=2576891 RepID=A0A290Q8K4_9BACT|nr:transcriptional repressor LexA [Nibricoccus aquaticus]ATC63510.1 repressor LexA [Nibricoccus aquaticus]
MLTEKQEAVLDYLRDYQHREGVPPSTRQISKHFGFTSQTSAVQHLRALAKRGLVEQLVHGSWGVKSREIQTHFAEVHVYGSIPAGYADLREQQTLETVSIDPALFGLSPRKKYWALVVSGDSMIDAHIVDGDLALLETREPKPGDIIAALIDGETTTLKRYVLEKGRAILRAANPRFADIKPDRLESQGVLVGLIGRGKR